MNTEVEHNISNALSNFFINNVNFEEQIMFLNHNVHKSAIYFFLFVFCTSV